MRPMNEVEFTALIPARLTSTRLPDKPLADIGGQAMVVRVAERAARSGARRVAVATDSERIAQVVQAAGFEVILTRSDHPSGTDRLAEAATKMGLGDQEIVVNVQGDEPLIPPELIRNVALCLKRSPECAIATAAHRIETAGDFTNPNVVKVVTDRRGRALYFSRAPIPFERDGAPVSRPATLADGVAGRTSETLNRAGLPLRHIGLYAYRAGFLRQFPELEPAALERIESLEQLRALWHGEAIAVHVTEQTPPTGVDTPEDLARVRLEWSSMHT